MWEGLARHGRPIQYAHMTAPLALWDVWTPIAGLPAAFEPPSASFALDWESLRAMRDRGVAFATITLAAGISSTGDPALDCRLPLDEPYRISDAAASAGSNPSGCRLTASSEMWPSIADRAQLKYSAAAALASRRNADQPSSEMPPIVEFQRLANSAIRSAR